ncbi:hypothetical protein CMT75_09040 [Elizabethkingia anophelis]|uniref:Transmembrane Fragile-X-F protein n=1 Tax=Elizabethkingia anophelis TaxID=1117645 RepID=A0AAE4P4P2_9FLAO|nr:hypothetical protein [Elizabethkingia anophelis]MDV3948664.1 hypothetical protein [Elizabethkingia anophelis]
MNNNSSNGSGLSLLGVLTIVFVVLKLTKVIAWSWWWVLAPTWIPVALLIAFAIIMLIIGGITYLFTKKRK